MADEVIVDNSEPQVVDNSSQQVETPVEETPKNWYDGLDPDLKNDPSIQKFKDPASMAKSYKELQKMIGKDKIILPTDKSTPEEWNEYYKKIGRPEDLTGYKVPDVDVPEEIKMRQETREAFQKKAHELGLTNKQFAELYAFQAEMSKNALNQEVKALEDMTKQTETALRKEFGAAYETKVDGAQKVINKFFAGKQMHKGFNVLASDAGFVKAMSEIAAALGEDSIAGNPRFTLTPAEAQAEYNRILADTKHPYHNDLSPEHSAAVDRVIELQQMANA